MMHAFGWLLWISALTMGVLFGWKAAVAAVVVVLLWGVAFDPFPENDGAAVAREDDA
jgi:hypothetical protein